jgi:hypothetical protein
MSKTAAHTPGPWEVVNTQGQYYVRRVGSPPGVGSVCKIVKTHDGSAFAWHRNQRLIAAAPDLLAAAESIYEELSNFYDGAPDSKTLWMGEYIDRLAVLIGQATATP